MAKHKSDFDLSTLQIGDWVSWDAYQTNHGVGPVLKINKASVSVWNADGRDPLSLYGGIVNQIWARNIEKKVSAAPGVWVPKSLEEAKGYLFAISGGKLGAK